MASLMPSDSDSEQPQRQGLSLRPVRVWHYFLGGGLSIVLMLALFEPSSAMGLTFIDRFLYFGLIILPILGGCITATSVAFRVFALRGPFAYMILVICGVMVSAAFSPYTLMLERAFRVQDVDDDHEAPAGFESVTDEMMEVVPTATIIWLLLNQLVIWSPQVRASRQTTVSSAVRDSATQSQIDVSRFGVQNPNQLMALEAQQHYLRVFATDETHFVLFGINAAADDLQAHGLDGMLVHRSYWVNWRYVKKLESRDGQYRCILVNGMVVPIARRRWSEAGKRFEASRKSPLMG
jgi:hypothetical protein